MGASSGIEQPSIEIPAQTNPWSPLPPSQYQQQQQHVHPQALTWAPQAPPAAVLAPGGYAVVSPAAPPVAHLPTPFIDVQRSGSCCGPNGSSSCCKGKSKSQPGHQQQQQQQQYQQQPQLGVGYQPTHVVCIGQPVKPPPQQQQQQQDCCSLGWMLYGLGWVFPLCWVAAIILPFLTKERPDRRAAVAAGVTLGVLAALIVLVVVVMVVVTSRV